MNQADLFTVPESLSPKEAWKREHGITVEHYPEHESDEPMEDDFGNEAYPWTATRDQQWFSGAQTEEEALWILAQKLKIPFYK